MVKHIIFGADDRVRINYKRLVYVNSLNPVCFAEWKNDRIGERYFGLEVMELKEVIKIYPKAKYFIASDYPYKYTYQKLLILMGIKEEDILNYEEFEYCHGCFWTRTFMTIYSRNMLPCTEDAIFDNTIECTDDISESVDEYLEFAENLIEKMRDRSISLESCLNCANYVKQMHPSKPKFHQIGYGVGHVCNSNCTYCARQYSERGARSSKKISVWQNEFDFSKFMRAVKSSSYYDQKVTQIFLGPAEITVHKNREKILEEALTDGTQYIVATNGIIYNEKIALLAAKKQNYLFISIDAGTKETYCKIKRVDMFENTIKNLIRYSEAGVNIYMKYIVLPNNIGNDDLLGFMKIVKDIMPIGVDISIDAYLPVEHLSDDMKFFAKKMATMLESISIPYIRYF